jgi:hypothetical protein
MGRIEQPECVLIQFNSSLFSSPIRVHETNIKTYNTVENSTTVKKHMSCGTAHNEIKIHHKKQYKTAIRSIFANHSEYDIGTTT